jgi:NOL1/NOP2/fmu family ribosome biogenesis protein
MLNILNKKESNHILELLEKDYDCNTKLDYVFLMNNKNRIYLANREAFSLDFKKLRISSIGIYFGEVYNDELRLSIEGSQMVGKDARQNVVLLDDTEARRWMKGQDIEKKSESRGFVIIRHNDDFLGGGKATEGKIWNFFPKTRRIMASD